MRVHDLRFLLILALPLLGLFNMARDPQGALVGTLVIWWGLALLDQWLPGGRRSPPPVAESAPQGFFTAVIWAYVPLQISLLLMGVIHSQNADWPVVLGLAFGVGFITGAQGITLAHELGHSRNGFSRLLGWILMTTVCYGHFMVEHYRGHHVRVATDADPASARRGESLYQFLPRTLWGSWSHAWRLEAAQLARLRKGWWQSPLVWSVVGSVLMLIAAPSLVLMGFSGLGVDWRPQAAIKIIAFLLLQSAVAVLLLETVNYIEHYGLRRAVQADGKLEAFGSQHAWNADHLPSNTLLANLQRHSDHHMHAWKPYGTLEDIPGSPRLPAGYPGCLLLAVIPPLWFRLMEPRLQQHETAAAALPQTAR
jgi:alkane 1-monooxygenase